MKPRNQKRKILKKRLRKKEKFKKTRIRVRIASRRVVTETPSHGTGRQSLAIETQSRVTETPEKESRETGKVGTRQIWDHLPVPAENLRIQLIQTEISKESETLAKRKTSLLTG